MVRSTDRGEHYPWQSWTEGSFASLSVLAGRTQMVHRSADVPIAIALTAVALNLLMGAHVSTSIQLSPWYSFFFWFPLVLFDAPLLEETGWRGYALPQYPAARSPLANTLILAVLITGWHVPIAFSDRTLPDHGDR